MIVSEYFLFHFQVYVQDLLRRDGQAISQFLTIDGAHVYISGNSDMAADVYTMLAAILADNLSITQRKATSYLLSMKVIYENTFMTA